MVSRKWLREKMKSPGIVIATGWEASGILKTFGFKKIGPALYQTTSVTPAVYLCVSGVGPEAARRASYRLCALGVGELISAGFCGALVPELNVGDLLTERVASSPTPIRTVEERKKMTTRANALAVDMETQAIIEAGTFRGVPIRVCRVISDRMEDDLTPLFGNDQEFIPWHIALRLLNPAVWPLANRLRKNSAIAQASLIAGLRKYFTNS
jgi:nucleoside phosphorylase